MTEILEKPCEGCPFTMEACNLIAGECHGKKLAALKQAEIRAQKKPPIIINFDAIETD
jgi:hypothetical protein